MKPSDDENRLTRWIDGELSDEEAAKLVEEQPEWAGERVAALAIGDRLRSAFGETPEIPYADFFNHQVRRRIEDDVFAPGESASEIDEPMRFPVFQRFRWLAAAGFVITFGALVAMVMRQAPGDRSEIVSTYTPGPDTKATTAYDAAADAVVIRVEGLPPIPAHVTIEGTFDRDRQTRGRVIYSLESRTLGCPVSLLARDHANDGLPGAMLVQF